MGCWCGHGHCPHCGYGHCHHCGYGYGYGYGPAPWAGDEPGYRPRRRRHPAADDEDLAAYLEDLEGEIRQVREELASRRRSRQQEEG